METPTNARKLAEMARSRGWQVEVTEGRGAIVTTRAPEGFWPAESVAVRLRSPRDRVRAFGVWAQIGDAKTKFDNGVVLWRKGCKPQGGAQGRVGYQELRDAVSRDDC